MSTTLILAGLGIAAAGYIGRYMLRQMPIISKQFNEAMRSLPKYEASGESILNAKYYKGGFNGKMDAVEAAQILGIRPSANRVKIREAFKKVMSANHPDRGGSPYIAAKVNEAKDLLEQQNQS